MADEQNPTPPPGDDPFTSWYRDTIQAHPETYDPAHFTEGQARAWFPLWSGHGFRSSKVDAQGNPIQGDSFSHPDECPPGTQAFGQNACAPAGQGVGGGGGGMPGGMGGGGSVGGFQGLGGYGPFSFSVEDFKKNDPGYEFGLKQSLGALQASAAAKGVLNTGGTLQGITGLASDYANQHYQDAWNRAFSKYRFNVDDEYRRENLLAGIGY